MADLIARLAESLECDPLVHYFEGAFQDYPDLLMKDMTLEEVGPDRHAKLNGRWVVTFGSDSFLGLDQDPRVWDAVRRGVDRWGTHNGSSRAFSSVASNLEAERKLATWLKSESTLIYPSVTLANHGALPALVTRHDALVVDRNAHHSVHEGMKLARSDGAKTDVFAHDDLSELERVLRRLRPYRHAVVAVDGIYSMTGTLPPLSALRAVAEANEAVLYVDDAHGTGILGNTGTGNRPRRPRGLLQYAGRRARSRRRSRASERSSPVPSRLKMLLKIRSRPIIFGGPVPPPYLDAVCRVVDILDSPEYDDLRSRLARNMEQFLAGVRGLGVSVLGGVGAIASVVVGDELATLRAGRELFERGYYVQSVVFPGVPHHGGVLRVQINANHRPESIAGLVEAIAGLLDSGFLGCGGAASTEGVAAAKNG